MEEIIKNFENIKNSKDSDIINDFLVNIGRDPKREYLSILDFFIDNHDLEVFNKIKINLIYILGELGAFTIIDDKYINFLIGEYFISDRWIRNEIVSAFSKIGNRTKLPKRILDILKYAIIDDYLPIVINGMKSLLYFDNIADDLLRNLFRTLKSQDSELNKELSKVMKKFFINEILLFEKLSVLDNYKNFDKKSIRSLIIIFFNSVISLKNLESFRDLIKRSEWENRYKEMFLDEINVYEKLLLRNY